MHQKKTSFTSRGCVGTAKNDPSLTAQWDDFSQLMSSDVTETFCQRIFSAQNVLLRYLLTKLIAFYLTHNWRLWIWNLKKLSYHHIKLHEWFFFQLSLQTSPYRNTVGRICVQHWCFAIFTPPIGAQYKLSSLQKPLQRGDLILKWKGFAILFSYSWTAIHVKRHCQRPSWAHCSSCVKHSLVP